MSGTFSSLPLEPIRLGRLGAGVPSRTKTGDGKSSPSGRLSRSSSSSSPDSPFEESIFHQEPRSVEQRPLLAEHNVTIEAPKTKAVPYVGTLNNEGMYGTGDIQGFRWFFAAMAAVFVMTHLISPTLGALFVFALAPLPAVGRAESTGVSALLALDYNEQLKAQGSNPSAELRYKKWRHWAQSINWLALVVFGALAIASHFVPGSGMLADAAQWSGNASTVIMGVFYLIFAGEILLRIRNRKKLKELLELDVLAYKLREAAKNSKKQEFYCLKEMMAPEDLKRLQDGVYTPASIAQIKLKLVEKTDEKITANNKILISLLIGFATIALTLYICGISNGGDVALGSPLSIACMGMWFLFNLSAYYLADGAPMKDAINETDSSKIEIGKYDKSIACARLIATAASIALFLFLFFYFGGPEARSLSLSNLPNIGLTAGCAVIVGGMSLYYSYLLLKKIYAVKEEQNRQALLKEENTLAANQV